MKNVLVLLFGLFILGGCGSASFSESGNQDPSSLGGSNQEGQDSVDGEQSIGQDELDQGELIRVVNDREDYGSGHDDDDDDDDGRDGGQGEGLTCRQRTPKQVYTEPVLNNFFSCDNRSENVAVCEIKKTFWGGLQVKSHCLCQSDLSALLRSCGKNLVFLGDCEYVMNQMSQK